MYLNTVRPVFRSTAPMLAIDPVACRNAPVPPVIVTGYDTMPYTFGAVSLATASATATWTMSPLSVTQRCCTLKTAV